MYEKHIEVLQNKSTVREYAEAVDAAIELMRAAEPKDAAAQAEIERLRADSWEALHSYRALQTKLTNLRTAAERALKLADTGYDASPVLREALEAVKS